MEERRARASDLGVEWEYVPTRGGLRLGAVVPARRGPTTYTFAYRPLGGASELRAGPAGDLVSDGFSVSRPVVLGSDGRQYPTTGWRLLDGPRISFDIDDTALPPGAFPYAIDPVVGFIPEVAGDDGSVGTSGPTPPTLRGMSVPATTR